MHRQLRQLLGLPLLLSARAMLFLNHDTSCSWMRNASRDSAMAGLRAYELCAGTGQAHGLCGPFTFKFHGSLMTYEGSMPDSDGACKPLQIYVEPGSPYASLTLFNGDVVRVVATQTEPRSISVNVYDVWQLSITVWEQYADVTVVSLTPTDDDPTQATHTEYADVAASTAEFKRGEDGVYHGMLSLAGSDASAECLLQPIGNAGDAMWMVRAGDNASNSLVRVSPSNRYEVHMDAVWRVVIDAHDTGAHVSGHRAVVVPYLRQEVQSVSSALLTPYHSGFIIVAAALITVGIIAARAFRPPNRQCLVWLVAATGFVVTALIVMQGHSQNSIATLTLWIARLRTVRSSAAMRAVRAHEYINVSSMLTVAQLLPLYHPQAPYPPTRQFRAELMTGWFGGYHPYFKGDHVCPASGCKLRLTQWTHDYGAHALLYFMGPDDYFLYVQADTIRPPARNGRQLVVMMASEVFDLERQPAQVFSHFNAEHSMRPSDFVRDSYVLWFINDAVNQGMRPQGAVTSSAKVWEDIWEAPLPLSARHRGGHALASWASGYCQGSASNREQLVRELIDAGLNVAVFGDVKNCLRNVNASLLSASRSVQHGAMRASKFHLAFENHRMEGYVTEKFYFALLRGQVPVVWGAHDISRHAPGPHSYIDVSDFASPRALVEYLHALDADDAAYEEYHAWRTSRSFADYGDVLRDELLEVIWLANFTSSPQDWYSCRLCHALERATARGDIAVPVKAVDVELSPPPPRLLGLQPMAFSARPGWPTI